MKNAFTYRNVFRGWLIYAAMGVVQIASAYVTPAPPPGFSNTPDGWAYKGQWVNGSARSAADLNVAGRRVQIPVYFRVSPNAAQTAARYIFRHPLVTAAAAASILVPMGVEWANGQWTQATKPNYPVSTGFTYRSQHFSAITGSIPTVVCQMVLTHLTQTNALPSSRPHTATVITTPQGILQCIITQSGSTVYQGSILPTANSQCPAGWFITPAGCVQNAPPVTRPLTEDEFVPLVAPQISPAQVPNIIPNTVPIPVERPVINPSPRTVPDPYTPPVPRPLIVPLADPVMVPNTEPQQWRQPLVQINPSPTVDNPWRVSLSPKERITTSPHGITQPVSDLDPATPAQPSAEPNLCIENPGILGCAPVPEFDVPQYEIPKLEESIEFTPNTAFHASGSCPAPITISIGGRSVSPFDMSYMCNLVSTYLRPILIFLASLTSVMIVAGGFRM